VTKPDKGAEPAADAVRAELERILESEPFRPSAQLRVFLRFVVETTLKGEADRIRAFTIAVEAFGRGKDFNPQTDPIVRVEAARLRRAIEHYYAGPGADDPVEIRVPRGGYVPAFSYRPRARADAPPEAEVGLAAEAAPPAVTPQPIARPLPLRYPLAAVLLLLIAAAGVVVLRVGPAAMPEVTASLGRPETTPRGSPLPVVLFEPVAPSARALGAIRARLIDALARFDDIEVAAERPTAGVPSAYRITITGEQHADGAIVPTVQLIDSGGGTVVWASSFDRVRAEDDLAAMSESIAIRVAPVLAQPYGVIYARERVRAAQGGDERYQCLLNAIEYRRTLDTSRHDEHARLRACLERAIASDPAFPSAQAALSFLMLREFYAGRTRDAKVLDDALRLALRAVELKPGSARARHVLMTILFARGDVAAALAEGERAIALNPYDMTAVTGIGLRLAFAGRAAEGRAMLERAAMLSPVRPPTIEFAQFLVNYTLGDDARAAHHAGMLTDEIHPFVLIARALVAIRAGERARAQQIIDRLFTLYPAWRIGARSELERYVPADDVVDRVMRDLAPVGFSATN
jgi:tetratricopeptide (TPR) repeat protein